MALLNSVSFQRLEAGLKAANMRHGVLSNNVANADTPNYKRSDVSFESLLRAQESGLQPTLGAKMTNSRHIPFGMTAATPQAVKVEDHSTAMNNNGNNVDIDREMALSAENQLRYNSYVSAMNSQITMMRAAVEGR